MVGLYMEDSDSEIPWIVAENLVLCEGEYFEIFTMIDVNRAGGFSILHGDLPQEEIAECLKMNGLTPPQCKQFFALCENDFVDFNEFKRVMGLCLDVKLRYQERIFLTFEDPTSSHLSYLISVIMTSLILLSTIAFLVESLPEIKEQVTLQISALSFACLLIQSVIATPV